MHIGNVLAVVLTLIPLCAVVLLPTSTPDEQSAQITSKDQNDFNSNSLRAWTSVDDDDDLMLLDDTLYLDDDYESPVHDQESPHVDELPLLILHVGPRNTGASTIQSVAASSAHLLEKDNIYFMGHNSLHPEWNTHEIYQQCSTGKQDKDDVDCNEAWSEFNEKLEMHRSKNHSIFVSDELFTSFPEMKDIENLHLWKHLVPLLQEKWRVRVIFCYRRYFEWIHSRYSQIYNPDRWEYGGEMVEIWEEAGFKKLHSFADYFEAVRNDGFKYPPAIKDRWQEHFEEIDVFNFHGDGYFVENFFCQHIPEARSLCRDLRSRIVPDPPLSTSSSAIHQYDTITMEAYRRGWVSNSNRPQDVTAAVEMYANENNAKIPLKCLEPAETAILLNMSLSMEKDMLPGFFNTPLGEERLRTDFTQASIDGLFCSVDVNKILDDEGWKQVFQAFESATSKVSVSNGASISSDLPIDYPQLDVELSWMGIGAQGAGTTWLAAMLMECCPSVVFGSRKELHFWDWYRRYGLGWYSNQFPNRTEEGQKSFYGEITPSYLSLPDEDIREIKALFPDVRIIFMARDLVERAWSGLRKGLRKEVKHGKAPTLNTANYTDGYFMKKASGRGQMERSIYELGMERWFSHFPDDQILVVSFDDMSNDPSGLLRKVLNHIGVENPEEYLKTIEEEEQQQVNPGVFTSLRPSLRKKLEDLFRPHAKAFNELLREHGYSWFLNEYETEHQ